MEEKHHNRERKVGQAIRSMNGAFKNRFLKEGLAVGLDEVTIMHGWIMGYLKHNEHRDIYQKTIESDFSIGRSSVTSLVKLMENKGYIAREAVPGDARLKKIVLTELGDETARKSKDALDGMEHQMLAGVEEKELEIFFKVSDQIVQNLRNERKEEV